MPRTHPSYPCMPVQRPVCGEEDLTPSLILSRWYTSIHGQTKRPADKIKQSEQRMLPDFVPRGRAQIAVGPRPSTRGPHAGGCPHSGPSPSARGGFAPRRRCKAPSAVNVFEFATGTTHARSRFSLHAYLTTPRARAQEGGTKSKLFL